MAPHVGAPSVRFYMDALGRQRVALESDDFGTAHLWHTGVGRTVLRATAIRLSEAERSRALTMWLNETQANAASRDYSLLLTSYFLIITFSPPITCRCVITL